MYAYVSIFKMEAYHDSTSTSTNVVVDIGILFQLCLLDGLQPLKLTQTLLVL